VTPGLLRFRLRVAGRPPDTREPEQTPFVHRAANPVQKMCAVAQALQVLGEDRAARVRHPALEAAIGRSTNLHLASLQGGTPESPGRVADVCELTGTVTFPPGERMEDVQAEIGAAVGAVQAADSWLRGHPPALEWLVGTEGAEVSPTAPVLSTVRETIRAVTGRPPEVNALHASSDIAHPILVAGIPTVGFGPQAGAPDSSGSREEWVDIAEYEQTVEVIRRLILSWGEADRGGAGVGERS
jgi:acetylornithine deacetylase